VPTNIQKFSPFGRIFFATIPFTFHLVFAWHFLIERISVGLVFNQIRAPPFVVAFPLGIFLLKSNVFIALGQFFKYDGLYWYLLYMSVFVWRPITRAKYSQK